MKLLALDVGEKRIGVAKAETSVKIAVPAGMIPVDGRELSTIVHICKIQNIDIIVVGMPRNLKGELTAQSEYVKNFVKTLNQTLQLEKPNNKTIRIYFQDESLTSVQAKENLKKKGFNKKAGDVDTEAATIILQDFLENLARRVAEKKIILDSPEKLAKSSTAGYENPANPSAATEVSTSNTNNDTKGKNKDKKKTRLALYIIIAVVAVLGLGYLCASLWYHLAISPVIASEKCPSAFSESETNPCESVSFVVESGSSVSGIAESLASQSLIKNALAFKVYSKLSGKGSDLKAGTYRLSPSMPVETIYTKLVEGASDAEVFRLTILPGETLKQVKARIIAAGYSAEEVEAAFAKEYTHPVLMDKPAEASLEGYLFGETYEFYKDDTVETIIVRMLDELESVVEQNDLVTKFANLGYTLHEGIVMASVVQREAGTVSVEDQKIVAQVFWKRLANDWQLGSDVTASYAADLVDPERKVYTDNLAVLEIDSCYNTRKYAGLPCGAISSPGATVLISTANPADTSYLYFLTGDDGMMYYSYTEAEHLQNKYAHCQVLCESLL